MSSCQEPQEFQLQLNWHALEPLLNLYCHYCWIQSNPLTLVDLPGGLWWLLLFSGLNSLKAPTNLLKLGDQLSLSFNALLCQSLEFFHVGSKMVKRIGHKLPHRHFGLGVLAPISVLVIKKPLISAVKPPSYLVD